MSLLEGSGGAYSLLDDGDDRRPMSFGWVENIKVSEAIDDFDGGLGCESGRLRRQYVAVEFSVNECCVRRHFIETCRGPGLE